MRETSHDQPPSPPQFDAFLPPEIAERAEQVGIRKAHMPAGQTLMLAVLAGAFIALGAAFFTTVTTGCSELPFGLARLAGGLAFCLGLVLVIVAGAELFTGNNLLVMAWADGRITFWQLARNWLLVYAGNFVGALATAGVVYVSRQHTFGGGAVGLNALRVAVAKCRLEFVQAIALGILCNALVCLAVWLCLSARTTTDKILSIVFPITAFVTAGFEHSIANMYFVPIGLLIKSGGSDALGRSNGLPPEALTDLTWNRFVFSNLVPVTIGNAIGGAVMVGLVYWFVYLRDKRSG